MENKRNKRNKNKKRHNNEDKESFTTQITSQTIETTVNEDVLSRIEKIVKSKDTLNILNENKFNIKINKVSLERLMRLTSQDQETLYSNYINYVIINTVMITSERHESSKKSSSKEAQTNQKEYTYSYEIDPKFERLIQNLSKCYVIISPGKFEDLTDEELMRRTIKINRHSMEKVMKINGYPWLEITNYMTIKTVTYSYEEMNSRINTKGKTKDKKMVEQIKIEIDPVYERLLGYMQIYHMFLHENCSIPITTFTLKRICQLVGIQWYEIVDFISIVVLFFTYEELQKRKRKFNSLISHSNLIQRGQESDDEDDGNSIYKLRQGAPCEKLIKPTSIYSLTNYTANMEKKYNTLYSSASKSVKKVIKGKVKKELTTTEGDEEEEIFRSTPRKTSNKFKLISSRSIEDKGKTHGRLEESVKDMWVNLVEKLKKKHNLIQCKRLERYNQERSLIDTILYKVKVKTGRVKEVLDPNMIQTMWSKLVRMLKEKHNIGTKRRFEFFLQVNKVSKSTVLNVKIKKKSKTIQNELEDDKCEIKENLKVVKTIGPHSSRTITGTLTHGQSNEIIRVDSNPTIQETETTVNEIKEEKVYELKDEVSDNKKEKDKEDVIESVGLKTEDSQSNDIVKENLEEAQDLKPKERKIISKGHKKEVNKILDNNKETIHHSEKQSEILSQAVKPNESRSITRQIKNPKINKQIETQDQEISQNSTTVLIEDKKDETLKTTDEKETITNLDKEHNSNNNELVEYNDSDGNKHLVTRRKLLLLRRQLKEDEHQETLYEIETSDKKIIKVPKLKVFELTRTINRNELEEPLHPNGGEVNPNNDINLISDSTEKKIEDKPIIDDDGNLRKNLKITTDTKVIKENDQVDEDDNYSDGDIIEVEDMDNKKRLIHINSISKISIGTNTNKTINVIDLDGSIIRINPHLISYESKNIFTEILDIENNKILVSKSDLKCLIKNSHSNVEVITDRDGIKRKIHPFSNKYRTNETIINSINQVEIKEIETVHKEASQYYEESVEYIFTYKGRLSFGDAIYVTGSCEELGGWTYSIRLDNISEDKWLKIVRIKHINFPFEYKYFISKYNAHPVNSYAGLTLKDNLIKAYPSKWLGEGNISVNQNHLEIILRNNNLSNRVFSLNTRYLNTIDGINVWDNRKDLIMNTIYKSCTDLIGLQEIRQVQLPYLEKNLNGIYFGVGTSRSNFQGDEQCRLYYNHQKFYFEEWGQFWLSSTPNQVSITFNNHFPRVATWAKFSKIQDLLHGNKDRPSYYYFNTHLDHVSKESRIPCVDVLLKRIKIITESMDSNEKIIFITGCFYSEDDEEPITMIKEAGFRSCSEDLGNHEKTFHDFTGEGIYKYDHIFYKTNELRTSHYEVITDRKNKTNEINGGDVESIYPSDHFPIFAEIK